jgi:hypothetical protein
LAVAPYSTAPSVPFAAALKRYVPNEPPSARVRRANGPPPPRVVKILTTPPIASLP